MCTSHFSHYGSCKHTSLISRPRRNPRTFERASACTIDASASSSRTPIRMCARSTGMSCPFISPFLKLASPCASATRPVPWRVWRLAFSLQLVRMWHRTANIWPSSRVGHPPQMLRWLSRTKYPKCRLLHPNPCRLCRRRPSISGLILPGLILYNKCLDKKQHHPCQTQTQLPPQLPPPHHPSLPHYSRRMPPSSQAVPNTPCNKNTCAPTSDAPRCNSSRPFKIFPLACNSCPSQHVSRRCAPS